MLPNLSVSSCIKMNVKYNLPAAHLECRCKAARNCSGDPFYWLHSCRGDQASHKALQASKQVHHFQIHFLLGLINT